MTVTAIAAMTPSGVIGNNNQLPWPKIKEDFQWFKEKTMGHVIIMGRRTFESLGRPLPGRTNYVISKDSNLRLEGCKTFQSILEAIYAGVAIDPEPYIIGGASVYEQAMPYVAKILLTEVKKEYPGDCYFPKIVDSEWDKQLLKESDLVKFWQFSRKTAI